MNAPPTELMVSTAEQYFPTERRSLPAVREAAMRCRACPLYATGTQTVFGEGSRRARLVLVGEQPGNEEDLQGHPFVGPAGRLLDRALESAGIARTDAYVTNVVKHFKWVAKGKRRLHQKPNAREIGACLPWLEIELDLIKPQILVCLGATAAQALLGKTFKVSELRGMFVESTLAPHVMATVHPSSILRTRTAEEREQGLHRFVADLEPIAELLKAAG